MKKTQKTILIMIFATALIWSAITLLPRVAAESKNNVVEIAVFYEEAKKISDIDNYPFSDFIDRLKAGGVTTMIFEEENIETLEKKLDAFFVSVQLYDQLRFLDIITEGSPLKKNTFIFQRAKLAAHFKNILKKRYGVAPVERRISSRTSLALPSNMDFEKVYLGFHPDLISSLNALDYRISLSPSNMGDPAWLFDFRKPGVASFIIDEKERFTNKKNFVYELSLSLNYIDFEFYPSGARELVYLNSVIRGHKIPKTEKISLSGRLEISRYMRAVRERGIRFIHFRLDEKIGVEGNLDQIKTLSKGLKKSGYILGPAKSPNFPVLPLKNFRQILCIFLSIILPSVIMYVAVYISKTRVNYIAGFLLTNSLIFSSGLLVASFVSSKEFMIRLTDVPGIKLIMLFSFIIAALVLFTPEEIKSFFDFQLRSRHLFYILFVFFAAALVILRSGNVNIGFETETRLRELLEKIFYIRPRWKEILLGQPLLLLAIKNKNRVFLLIGSMAAISVINTFLHAHTPLAISMYRTILGALVGGTLGLAVSIMMSTKK